MHQDDPSTFPPALGELMFQTLDHLRATLTADGIDPADTTPLRAALLTQLSWPLDPQHTAQGIYVATGLDPVECVGLLDLAAHTVRNSNRRD